MGIFRVESIYCIEKSLGVGERVLKAGVGKE